MTARASRLPLTLRAYPTLLRIGVLEAVAYRAELFVWMLTMTMPLVSLVLWSSAAAGTRLGREQLSGTDLSAYFLLTLLVRMLTSSWVLWQLTDEIRTGALAQRLLKPVSPFAVYTAEQLAALPLRAALALPLIGVLLAFSLRAQLSHEPLLWLAAPLTGLIVQPVIGYWSDRTWNRLGRRLQRQDHAQLRPLAARGHEIEAAAEQADALAHAGEPMPLFQRVGTLAVVPRVHQQRIIGPALEAEPEVFRARMADRVRDHLLRAAQHDLGAALVLRAEFLRQLQVDARLGHVLDERGQRLREVHLLVVAQLADGFAHVGQQQARPDLQHPPQQQLLDVLPAADRLSFPARGGGGHR